MVSPYVAEAAERAARIPSRDTDAIGNQTFYTILARWPREVRLMTVEWKTIESDAEALEAVQQSDHAVFVFRHDWDIPRRDVSADIARLWLDELLSDGWNPEEDEWPDFLSHHLTNDEAVREFVEQRR